MGNLPDVDRVLILAGSHDGDNCVAAAGAVVTKPVPPNTSCPGNPATPIKAIEH
jgi:acetyltransferase-like isoleucine patch superfamily enzyme